MFLLNTRFQSYYYFKLQSKLNKVIKNKTENIGEKTKRDFLEKTILYLSSAAVVPSFSRFIEESHLFNNPGGFIGMVKSIMGRNRFHKNKYLMRIKIADMVNLVWVGKNSGENSVNPSGVAEFIHDEDIALDYKDEKIGLVAFDVFGFGAIIIVGIVMYLERIGMITSNTSCKMPVIMLAMGLLFLVVVSHVCRHYAFERYENIVYEFSFATILTVSYLFFVKGTYEKIDYILLGIGILQFLLISLINRIFDKKLHKGIDQKLNNIIRLVDIDTEIGRVIKRSVENLKVISLYSISTQNGKQNGKNSILGSRLEKGDKKLYNKSWKIENFDTEKRNNTSGLLLEALEQLLGLGTEDNEIEKFFKTMSESDFELTSIQSTVMKISSGIIGYGSFAVLVIYLIFLI